MTTTGEEQERLDGVLSEKDAFRLAIRASALFEELIDDAISDAFPEGTPKELSHLRLSARLALAVALELITPAVARVIRAVAKIRNEFAHTTNDQVTKEHARELAAALGPLAPDVDFDDYSWGDVLRVSVLVLWDVTSEMIDQSLIQREQAAAELTLLRSRISHPHWGEDRGLMYDHPAP